MDDAMRMLYTVVEGERGEAMVYSSGVDELVSPEDLSAWLLRHLAGLAEAALGEAVTGAVVTVPAHFNFLQRSATVRAAEAAGLAPVALLQGPRVNYIISLCCSAWTCVSFACCSIRLALAVVRTQPAALLLTVHLPPLSQSTRAGGGGAGVRHPGRHRRRRRPRV